jgi:hypothetical protein
MINNSDNGRGLAPSTEHQPMSHEPLQMITHHNPSEARGVIGVLQ